MSTPATTSRADGGAVDAIDVCDRCLALSQLTVALAKVPKFWKPEPLTDDEREGRPAHLPSPLVFSPDGLEPTPGDLVRAVEGITADRAKGIAADHREWRADAVRAAAERGGLAAFCSCSERYPAPLRDLADPPPVLYVRGDGNTLGHCPIHAVAMVGTRHPTLAARDTARRIGDAVARGGGLVISGMALGIDAASHEGALRGGGPTVAVLASGADRATPASNRNLYHQILDRGAVVSELPPGTRPFLWTFPARNRIIAALADTTVVVEAPRKSGALITAEQAYDIGRDVHAVPGSLANDMAEGTNRLLQAGAGVLLDPMEFVELLELPRAVGRLDPPPGPGSAIHGLLRRRPMTIGELEQSVTSSLEPGELELVLLDLELAGWVGRRPDGRYCLVQPAVAAGRTAR